MLTAVHTDIAHAGTPAAAFYTDAQILRAQRERVFARAWQLVGHLGELAAARTGERRHRRFRSQVDRA